ncbi:MAG: hypothetical protein MUE85_15575 [Microscillaceae bacterium]|jgi:hypothetical protein|nr:hypothetical protein [Microscillaceae bacterium]
MKKITCLFFIFMGILFYGCQTNQEGLVAPDETQPKITENVSLKDGRLHFQSIDYYRDFLDKASKTEKTKFIEKLNEQKRFVSIAKIFADNNLKKKYQSSKNAMLSQTISPIESEFFSSILNADGIVQIGKYIFKIDLVQQKCLVLEEKDLAFYQDLIEGNLNQGKIKDLSNEEDALEALENPSENGQKALFCREGGQYGQKAEWIETYAALGFSDLRADCKVVYQKGWVYFSLQAKIKNQKNVLGIWFAQTDALRIDYDVRYKPKCRGEFAEVWYDNEYDNEANHRAYESSRALNKLWYVARFRNQSIGYVSPLLEIKAGY